MSDPTPPTNGAGGIFAPEHRPRDLPILPFLPLAIAGGAVLLILAVLLFLGPGHSRQAFNQIQPLDPYASSLAITGPQMSQSSNIVGGTSTYLDGHIANNGPRTITGITVQVVFRNDVALPPQIETTPVALIRSREPYVDTQPVGAAPLAPGTSADFRLIFESLNSNWNQQMPEIRVIQVTTK